MTEDKVNHPAHYNAGKIEVIEFIEDQGLAYHLGNAVKYIARAGKKDPVKVVEDLEKAIWYVKRQIEILKPNPLRPNQMGTKAATSGYISATPASDSDQVELPLDTANRVLAHLDSEVCDHKACMQLRGDHHRGAQYPDGFKLYCSPSKVGAYFKPSGNFINFKPSGNFKP